MLKRKLQKLSISRIRKEGKRSFKIEVLPQNDPLLDFRCNNYQRCICLQIKGEARNSGEKMTPDEGVVGSRGGDGGRDGDGDAHVAEVEMVMMVMLWWLRWRW